MLKQDRRQSAASRQKALNHSAALSSLMEASSLLFHHCAGHHKTFITHMLLGKLFPSPFTSPALSFCGSNPLCFHHYMGITAASNNPLPGPSTLGQHIRSRGTKRARKSVAKAEGHNAGDEQRQLGKSRQYPRDKWLRGVRNQQNRAQRSLAGRGKLLSK